MPAKPARAGQYRHRVEFQAPTETPDSYGQPVQEWVTYAKRWASVEPMSGRELARAQQVFAEVTHLIECRHVQGLTAKHRVKWGSRIFELGPPLNPGEQGGTTVIEITAKETDVG